MKYSRPSADSGKHGVSVHVSCISCGNKTIQTDGICLKCDTIFPEHLPKEQYDNYFKLLGKKNK